MTEQSITTYNKTPHTEKLIVISAFIISILAICITGISFSYLYFNIRAADTENKYLQQRLADYKSLISDEIKNETLKIQDNTDKQDKELNAKISVLLLKADSALEKVSSQASTWTLSEINYLILAGVRQLKLFHDKLSATTYFENAKQIAAGFENDKFVILAQNIQTDINYIKELVYPDKNQIIAQIKKLSESINKSPLHEVLNPVTTNEEAKNNNSWWLNTLGYLQKIIKNQYRFYNTPGPNKILLTIQEQQQIKQIITNYLEEAELAILQNNQSNYQQYLNNVNQWLNRYKLFEQEYTKNTTSQVTELESINFSDFNEENLLSPKLVKEMILK